MSFAFGILAGVIFILFTIVVCAVITAENSDGP